LVLTFIFAQDSSFSSQSIHKTILENFKKDTKSLFKVWHFIFNKTYDYNTLEGLNKYKTFKANLKRIEEHNKGNSSYKKGLNHLSDMTYEEIKKYYNLKPINTKQVSKSLRALNSYNLDDYNEDEEAVKTQEAPQGPVPIDHRSIMRPVRDQGLECGACWSFTTMAVLEAFYVKQVGPLNDWFSTQYSVDCDEGNSGCHGGWFHNSFKFYLKNNPIMDKNYPYKAKKNSCFGSKLNINAKVLKLNIYDSDNYPADTPESLYRFLALGPVAVAVDANDNFSDYASGVYDGECLNEVNHAVTLVGYSASSNGVPAHYIIRNSWGAHWGEKGHIRVAQNSRNSSSCNIERFGFQGLFKRA
jgi:KDEL-tailed cysteine endopeptidase